MAAVEVRSSKFEALTYMKVRKEQRAAGKTKARETPSFTVKVEDLVIVYRWLERHIDGWRGPVSGKDVFARQQLPPGIALELELEDAPVVELSLDEKKKKEEGIAPQVVFYASGETTVGAINVRQLDNGELLWRLEWDLLGRFEVLRRGEPETEEDEDE